MTVLKSVLQYSLKMNGKILSISDLLFITGRLLTIASHNLNKTLSILNLK